MLPTISEAPRGHDAQRHVPTQRCSGSVDGPARRQHHTTPIHLAASKTASGGKFVCCSARSGADISWNVEGFGRNGTFSFLVIAPFTSANSPEIYTLKVDRVAVKDISIGHTAFPDGTSGSWDQWQNAVFTEQVTVPASMLDRSQHVVSIVRKYDSGAGVGFDYMLATT